MRQKLVKLAYTSVLLLPVSAQAGKVAIDKIYHPYVQSMEKELEWRAISADNDKTNYFSYGQSLSDNFYLEGSINSQETTAENYKVSGFELEGKWQLTEQGEYSTDWGLVTELNKTKAQDSWEASTALIAEKQWGQWLGTANVWLIYEWGSDRSQQLNPALSLQARYRYSPYLEPAVEFYSGKYTEALGPVLMGDLNFSDARKLHWEAGAIMGLDAQTPNLTWRFLTEFEF